VICSAAAGAFGRETLVASGEAIAVVRFFG
jgi:hypothetical protein